jgi:hypothetical protein
MGDFIRYYDDVDVSVAVQTPNGLMVPIVKHADELGLLEISAQVKSLAKKVRPWGLASVSFPAADSFTCVMTTTLLSRLDPVLDPPQALSEGCFAPALSLCHIPPVWGPPGIFSFVTSVASDDVPRNGMIDDMTWWPGVVVEHESNLCNKGCSG